MDSFSTTGELAAVVGLDIYLHAIYLINLASENEEIYNRSIAILRWNLRAAAALRAKAVTFHVGSRKGRTFEEVTPRIAVALDAILRDAPAGPQLLLENSAGAGDCIGRDFGELGDIIREAGSPPNLGVCMDTAHAFAMGHELQSGTGVRNLISHIDSACGLDRLKLIHANDSKAPLGSCRDRHENIGAGAIGEEGFRTLLHSDLVTGRPIILETPNIERRPEELATLRRLATEKRLAA